jgi:hypothetical protein
LLHFNYVLDCVFGLATGWTIADSNPSRGKGFFSSQITPSWVFWAHPASQLRTGYFPADKRIDGVKIKPFSAEIKNR